MKKLLFLLISLIVLTNCSNYTRYEYTIKNIIPDNDSLKQDILSKSIISLEAADYMLSTTKYKNPEDVLNCFFYNSKSLYEIPTQGLSFIYRENGFNNITFIPFDHLTSDQRIIFYKLKCKVNNRYLK